MALLVQQPNNSEEIENFTYDNNMKRSIVYYITDVKKSFDHCFRIINSLITKKKKINPSKRCISDCACM